MTEGVSWDTPPTGADDAMPADAGDDIARAEALTELKLQEVAYRGALGTTERVLQPTLKNFLR